MILRDYQQSIASLTLDAIKDHKRIIVTCPTGSGKTVIAIHGILPGLTGRTAWVTHRRELARQVYKHGSKVIIAMVQAELSGKFDNIIIDEGHHVCADQYIDVLRKYPDAKVIALTATPYRLDGVGFGSCGFSKIVYGPDEHALTECGVLCPVSVFVPASKSISAWDTEATASAIMNVKFDKGVVFCRTIEDAQALANQLTSKKCRSAAVHGAMNTKSRDDIYNQFEEGHINVVCNHSVFTEGVDVPSIDLVVLNRFTQSRGLWKQMIGRGTRVAPGKFRSVVLDLAGNGTLHGSIYDEEIYGLDGSVIGTEQRELSGEKKVLTQYEYNAGEELIEWKPQAKLVRFTESLHRRRGQSLLRRLRTGLSGC